MNVVPLAFMKSNCLSWILYSYLIADYYVCAPSTIGYILTIYYLNVCVRLADVDLARRVRSVVMAADSLLILAAFLVFVPFKDSDAQMRSVVRV